MAHNNRAFKIGIVCVLALLCLPFIDRFSIDLNWQRYSSLSDDQMISMRHADNLASGRGWPGVRENGSKVSSIPVGPRTWRRGT